MKVQRASTDKSIQSKTIRQFQQYFKSGNAADYMRSEILWDNRQNLLSVYPSSGQRKKMLMYDGYDTLIGNLLVRTKSIKGLGRNCESWVLSLAEDMFAGLDLLRKLYKTFSPRLHDINGNVMILFAQKGSNNINMRPKIVISIFLI